MLRILVALVGMFVVSGCSSEMTRKYVIQDEPRLIEVQDSGSSTVQPVEIEPSMFEDISLSEKKRREILTNNAVVEKETKQYVKTGEVDTISWPDGTVLFPYGLWQPKLVCERMFLCTISLQEGEQVLDMSAGDTVRWQTKVTYKGKFDKFVPMIQVKPFFGNLSTNLSIVTDRRDYNVILTSIEAGEYTPRIGFFYPQEDADKEKIPAPPMAKQDSVGAARFDIDNVHFNYVIEGNKSLRWFPVSVFDDGKKVFIRMSDSVTSGELPIFIVINEKGQKEVVNYRFKKPHFIVDRLFERGELILGSDHNQIKVIIRKK